MGSLDAVTLPPLIADRCSITPVRGVCLGAPVSRGAGWSGYIPCIRSLWPRRREGPRGQRRGLRLINNVIGYPGDFGGNRIRERSAGGSASPLARFGLRQPSTFTIHRQNQIENIRASWLLFPLISEFRGYMGWPINWHHAPCVVSRDSVSQPVCMEHYSLNSFLEYLQNLVFQVLSASKPSN